MKNLYSKGLWVLIVLTLYVRPLTVDAQCNGDVTLSTQAQINAFPATHDCSEIIGTLTISGTDITNVDSLYLLTRVGMLDIHSNPSLTNLHGLSGLSHVGRAESFFPFSMMILGNPLLTNLKGLGSLKIITGGLFINQNASLVNFNGLDSLHTIGGTVQISGNAALTSLQGFKVLNSVGTFNNMAMVIDNNPALVSMKGFPLKSLPGRFAISNNAGLVNLNGLDSLKRINGSLYLINNPLLRNTNGLLGLTELGGPTARETILQISGNSMLQKVDGLSSLKKIVGENGASGLIISDNAALKDLSGLSSLDSLNGFLEILSNPELKNLEGLSGLKTIGVTARESLVITGNRQLKNLRGLESLTNIPGGMLIQANDSLKSLDGLASVVSIGGVPFECCPSQPEGALRITDNPSLRNIDALSNVTTVYQGIFIRNNPSLKNLDGFSSLTTIKVLGAPGTDPQSGLEIKDNTALKNLDGLSSLTVMEGNVAWVVVTGNTALMRCCGLYPLLSNGLGCNSRPSCASVVIADNGAGCTQDDILQGGACAAQQNLATQPAAVYPNPSKGVVHFEVADDFVGTYVLGVYDLTNQLVTQQTILKSDRSLRAEINLRSVKKGMYVLKVTRSDGETVLKRLAVED